MQHISRKAVAVLAFGTALSGSLIAFPLILDNQAFALDTNAAQSASPQDHRIAMMNDLVEARLAYIKTALQITDAQTSQWDAVAAVIRKQAKEREDRMMAMHARFEKDGGPNNQAGQASQAPGQSGQPGVDMHRGHDGTFNVIDAMERREKMMNERAANLAELIAAAKPLYASLSDDQKDIANHLIMHGMHDEHHGWGHGDEHGGWGHGDEHGG